MFTNPFTNNNKKQENPNFIEEFKQDRQNKPRMPEYGDTYIPYLNTIVYDSRRVQWKLCKNGDNFNKL